MHDMGRIVSFCSSFLPFLSLYPAFSGRLCRPQLYCADQEGAGMQKKIALIVTRKDLQRTACRRGVVLGFQCLFCSFFNCFKFCCGLLCKAHLESSLSWRRGNEASSHLILVYFFL